VAVKSELFIGIMAISIFFGFRDSHHAEGLVGPKVLAKNCSNVFHGLKNVKIV
jgi:hypothetical protein